VSDLVCQTVAAWGGNSAEPGDYLITCNLPGHYQLAMVASLTVTG
jgi:uncharacterized cupredoxin-like copper-binding protein